MSVERIVILDKDTEFEGEMDTGQLILEGKVEGVVRAQEKIVLKAGASLEGEVTTGNFNMVEGSNFRGELKVKGNNGASGKPQPANSMSEKEKELTLSA